MTGNPAPGAARVGAARGRDRNRARRLARRAERRARRSPPRARARATSTTRRTRSCGARPARSSSRARSSTGRATSAGGRLERDPPRRCLARRGDDGLWTQRLYGQEHRSLTPPHGLVGNVEALVQLLDDDRRATLAARDGVDPARDGGRRGRRSPTGRRDPGRTCPGPDGQIRVQWCAGAPGIVIGAASYLDEDLLLAGAELVWRAGPPTMEKGPCICHGTAGNGYAFLDGLRAHRRRACGSSVRAGSRSTRSSRSSAAAPSAVAAATRSGRATSVRRSSPPTASSRGPRTRSSTRSTGSAPSGSSSQSATKGANHGR